jgi:hypothetical protein
LKWYKKFLVAVTLSMLMASVTSVAQAQSLDDGQSSIWCVENAPPRPWLSPTTTLYLSIAYTGFQEHNKPTWGNVQRSGDVRQFYEFSGFTFAGIDGRHNLTFQNAIAPRTARTVTYRAFWPRYVSDPSYPPPGRPASPGSGQVSRTVSCAAV